MTEQPLNSEHGGVPNCVGVWFPSPGPIGEWQEVKISLVDSEGRAAWLEHPRHRSAVDVAALKLELAPGFKPRTVNSKETVKDMLLEAGRDIFVLGFPRGITGGGQLPIWKRGTIASEPYVDLDDLPKMLVDATTREGMSGAPVIARTFGFYTNSSKQVKSGKPSYTQFLGVYSGRMGGDELLAQLGIVWKRRAIEEIITGGCRADSRVEPYPVRRVEAVRRLGVA